MIKACVRPYTAQKLISTCTTAITSHITEVVSPLLQCELAQLHLRSCTSLLCRALRASAYIRICNALQVVLRGRVHSVRGKGKSCFVILRQQTHTIQVGHVVMRRESAGWIRLPNMQCGCSLTSDCTYRPEQHTHCMRLLLMPA